MPDQRRPSRKAFPIAETLVQDTFQRDDQLFWGTASDNRQWEGDANRQPAFSIANTTGRITNAQGTFNALLGSVSRDTEVIAGASINAFGAGITYGLVSRWSNDKNWYKAQLDGSHLSILRCINGQTATLKAMPFTMLPERPYKLRFRTIGALLLAKAWPANEVEASDWQITASDTNLMSGRTGILVVIQLATTIAITSFEVRSASINDEST